jgi:SAM-dependent methyltransferase
MQKVFKQNVPTVPIQYGLSTNIPFEDEFFQVVFIAQAFHWFANIESLREIKRVIKPQSQCKYGKSGMVLIWNVEDAEKEPYILEIRNEFDKYSTCVPQYYKKQWRNVFDEFSDEISEYFSDLQTKVFTHGDIYLPLSFIWQRLTSLSFISVLSLIELEKFKEKVYGIFEKYKDCQKYMEEFNEMCLHYPHYTELTWCYKK